MNKPPWLQQVVSTAISVVLIAILGWIMGIPTIASKVENLDGRILSLEKKVEETRVEQRLWVGTISDIAKIQAKAIGTADAIHSSQESRLDRFETRMQRLESRQPSR